MGTRYIYTCDRCGYESEEDEKFHRIETPRTAKTMPMIWLCNNCLIDFETFMEDTK